MLVAEWKKFLANNKLDIAIAAGVAISDISKGKGVVKSIGGGLIDYAKMDIIGGIVGGPAMFANFAAQIGMLGVNVALENAKENTQTLKKNGPQIGRVGSRNFADNQTAYTMRQRSLEAIGGHSGMVYNALGSEARRRASNINY